jgi:pimeloyl-ACP methyl ester carboxylesterase
MPETVQSADGTTIAYERQGQGAPLVIIGGAFNDRGSVADIAGHLARHYTAYTYDRRGRGDSTDTAPYAPEREVEDLAALIDAIGGPVLVYGHSSGAVLAPADRLVRIAVPTIAWTVATARCGRATRPMPWWPPSPAPAG